MSRPPLSAEETEEQSRRIVEAAFTVIAQTGDLRPPIRQILLESGLSRQALYRCFLSKDDLMIAVLAEGRRLMVEYLSVRLAREPTPEGKVRAWIDGMMRQAAAPRAAERTRPFIASLGEGVVSNRREIDESERDLCSLLESALRDGVSDGIWDTVDPAAHALVVSDFVIGSLRRHLLARRAPTTDTTRALGDFTLRGVGMTLVRTRG